MDARTLMDADYSHALFYAGVNVARWSLGLPPRGVTLTSEGAAFTPANTADEIPVFDARCPLPAGVHPSQVVRVSQRASDHHVFMRVPTPTEQAIMGLTGRLAEGFPWLPPLVLDWPPTLLAELREPLDVATCLAAFPPPLTPDEALAHCYAQAQAVYFRYQTLIQDLAQTLVEARTMTSRAIRDACTTWQEQEGEQADETDADETDA
jgi:hypothetical protein